MDQQDNTTQDAVTAPLMAVPQTLTLIWIQLQMGNFSMHKTLQDKDVKFR